MAGRGSIGVGTGVTIFVLALFALAGIVCSAIFFAKWKDAEAGVKTARADLTDFVTAGERGRDDIRGLVTQAKGKRMSAISYMADQYGQVMTRVAGVKTLSIEQLEEQLKTVKGAEAGKTLVGLINERDTQIAGLERAAAESDNARKTALADLQAEVDRVKQLDDSHKGTIAALNTEIGTYKSDIDTSRAGIDVYRAKIDEQAAKDRSAAQDEKTQLGTQIKKLTDENLILKDQVLALRGARSSETLKGTDEFALVDGTVIGVDGAARQAFISLGRRNKVRVGMAFTVYADAAAVRPDKDGNFPRGKATLEIINVDESSSTCRILTESRGNPVVKEDVIVNAFYDPRKVYKMAVVGNFDVNRDGVATALEKNDLAALVREWGGQVVDHMAGDVDFLILGERPVTPPNPAADSPGEVYQEYIRMSKSVETYDTMYAQAQSTNVPTLTENRLYTLIGKVPAQRR